MKLSLKKIRDLEVGLTALDGYMSDGKAFPYNLSGTVRRIIGKNLALVKVETEAFNSARNALVRSMASEKSPNEVLKERLSDFESQIEVMLDEEEDLELRSLKLSALGLDGDKPNPIPGSVLALLDCLIVEE